MPLRPDQSRLILVWVRQQFGADVTLIPFGSRLDDSAHGRDVDLLVENGAEPTLRQRSKVTMALASGSIFRTCLRPLSAAWFSLTPAHLTSSGRWSVRP